jgi:F-type H+-transporting ATPase subunit delta
MAGAAAKRYARAIFELAREESQLEEWSRHIATVGEMLSVPEVQAVMANPTISIQERQAAIASLLDSPAGPEGVNLGKLLVGAGRLDEVAGIEEEYNRLVDEAAGRVSAIATTAVELSSEDYEGLTRSLSRQLGREVRLTAAVDPAVLGGLVLRLGDHVIDASLASRLQQLRRQLAGA